MLDLAHKGSGFPTWHRYLILWFERQIQNMLGDHLFRFRFWNWLDPEQRYVPFHRDRLGDNIDGRVVGDLVGDWSFVCWEDKHNSSDICNPIQPSNSKWLRCPNATMCQKYNAVWPDYTDYYKALSIRRYDVSPYNDQVRCTDESFRSYMEGFVTLDGSECYDDPMCTVNDGNSVSTLKLHNVVRMLFKC